VGYGTEQRGGRAASGSGGAGTFRCGVRITDLECFTKLALPRLEVRPRFGSASRWVDAAQRGSLDITT
jgi:hypothetical protein